VRWKRSEFIDQHTYRNLLVTDGVLSEGLWADKDTQAKLSNQNNSCIKSPLYLLASFLHNLIHNSIPKQFSHICNSYHFLPVNELNGQLLQTACELVSLDVVSLFTNVPIELINDSIVRRWNFISGVTSMPMEEFIRAIQMIVNSTFFIFNNKIYKQVFGLPWTHRYHSFSGYCTIGYRGGCSRPLICQSPILLQICGHIISIST